MGAEYWPCRSPVGDLRVNSLVVRAAEGISGLLCGCPNMDTDKDAVRFQSAVKKKLFRERIIDIFFILRIQADQHRVVQVEYFTVF